MGKPRNLEPAKISEDYNWGDFGSANAQGVNLSPMASQNVQTTQSGIGQYLNELINPSYSNESFRARQELIDASNRQYANQLGAQAMARGARGSATQNILNSIAANRNTDLRNAMIQEDARVRNILNSLSGIENQYFGQANTMGSNILQRALANQQTQQAANVANTQAYNQWRNNLLNTGVKLGTTALGAVFSPALTAMNTPYGDAIDPMQVMSANNMF